MELACLDHAGAGSSAIGHLRPVARSAARRPSPSSPKPPPTSPRAKRCSTAPWGRGASANRRRSCGAAAGRPKAWPSSRATQTGASSARCGCGTWRLGEGGRPALLLGPLAVDPSLKNAGIGSALMRHAIAEARAARPCARSCWSATRPTTRASASRRTRPARSPCPARMSGTGSGAGTGRRRARRRAWRAQGGRAQARSRAAIRARPAASRGKSPRM